MTEGPIRHYRDLRVWHKAIAVAKSVHVVTSSFPADERFGLISQMRRAAVSVPSNIAEGKARQHDSEFRQYLYIALGSLAELDTQLVLAGEFGYLADDTRGRLHDEVVEVRRMLHGLIGSLGSAAK